MNREQKMARFNLIVILASVVLSIIAVSVLYFVVGLPMHRALGGSSLMGFCGLAGLSPTLFRKKQGQVSFDERDLLIQKKASLRAYTMFWVLFVAAAMIPFFVLGPKGLISVKALPAMVIGGIITIVLVQSIVILEEYGWKDQGEKS
jgi:hypothetical protein